MSSGDEFPGGSSVSSENSERSISSDELTRYIRSCFGRGKSAKEIKRSLKRMGVPLQVIEQALDRSNFTAPELDFAVLRDLAAEPKPLRDWDANIIADDLLLELRASIPGLREIPSVRDSFSSAASVQLEEPPQKVSGKYRAPAAPQQRSSRADRRKSSRRRFEKLTSWIY
jgi:hypothetical protein